MGLLNRRTLFRTVELDGNQELDYLDTSINEIDLSTVRVFTVTEATAHRIDLISYMVYNTFALGWLICQHNDIIDPVNEIVVGRTLNIPSIDEFYRFMNRNRKTKDR